MFSQMTFEGMRNVTFSPESADGATLCALPVGQMTAQCGPEAVRASRSLPLEGEKEQQTNATSGPNSSGLSGSAALQSFLESRLPAKMALLGSTLFVLTWKDRVTPQGQRICALRASVRHTSNSGCTGAGWRTPNHSDGEGGIMEIRKGTTGHYKLRDKALLASPWPTPTTRDWKDGKEANVPTNSLLGREVWKISGGGGLDCLPG